MSATQFVRQFLNKHKLLDLVLTLYEKRLQ